MSARPPHELASWTAEARRLGAAIAGARPDKHDAEQAQQESLRSEMLATIDQQLAEITRQIDAQRAVSGMGGNNEQLAALEQQGGRLLSMRQNVEGATSFATLSQLRGSVTEVTRASADTTQASAATLAVSGGAGATFAARQIAQAEFHARMQNIERDMAPIMRNVERARAGDDRLAARYGIDVSRFNDFDDAMKREAEQKEKEGDRVGKVEADALRAWNAVGRSQQIIDQLPDGEEKRRKQAEQDKQREDARKADEAVRQAIEAEAKKEAAKGSFSSPEEKAAWEKARVEERMKGYEERKTTVPGNPSKQEEAKQEKIWGETLSAARSGETTGLAERSAPVYEKPAQAEVQAETKAAEGAGNPSEPKLEEAEGQPQAQKSNKRFAQQAKQAVETNPAKGSAVDVKEAENPQSGLPVKTADNGKGVTRNA